MHSMKIEHIIKAEERTWPFWRSHIQAWKTEETGSMILLSK